ncbi:MAG: hypothetical protein QXW00_02845 [Candidatus Woesearchaeota archaeon]
MAKKQKKKTSHQAVKKKVQAKKKTGQKSVKHAHKNASSKTKRNVKEEKMQRTAKQPKEEEEFYVDEDEIREEPFPYFAEDRENEVPDADEPGYDFDEDESSYEDEF